MMSKTLTKEMIKIIKHYFWSYVSNILMIKTAFQLCSY